MLSTKKVLSTEKDLTPGGTNETLAKLMTKILIEHFIKQ